jgi:hypothetical protein
MCRLQRVYSRTSLPGYGIAANPLDHKVAKASVKIASKLLQPAIPNANESSRIAVPFNCTEGSRRYRKESNGYTKVLVWPRRTPRREREAAVLYVPRTLL